MKAIIISTCDLSKDVKFAMISTLDLFEQPETGDDRSQFEPKLRRNSYDIVSKDVIERFKKELK